MPIEVALWRLDGKLKRVAFSPIGRENELEEVLANDITIVDPNFLLIGRQVPTSYGKFIDLLALDPDGNVVVIELKRNRTPREVVAQLLDYGSWVRSLKDDDLSEIFDAYRNKYFPDHPADTLEKAFCERFGLSEMLEALNDSHKLVVVAGELDDSTERIIAYLAEDYGVAINAVFFRFFRDEGREFLSRAWLIDPVAVEIKIEEKREKLPWNGEFYVSFGGDANRDWEEARKYGFVSAGGSSWHTKSLSMLEAGARIWVNMPGRIGYVGVGEVLDEVVPIDDFLVDDGSGGRTPITKLPTKAAKLLTKASDPDKAEQVVRVRWIKTVPVQDAFREKGFFGNQNTAAKPRTKRWTHTIERLKQLFGVTD
ncbi:MAG TPA: endonuclease NucS domain-containing protein [Pirellulales bacterium]